MNEFQNLINVFSKYSKLLWHLSLKGGSLKVITPIITVGDVFITLFVARRPNCYVITDGGWIDKGGYNENIPNIGNSIQIARDIAALHCVKETEGKGLVYFYVKTSNIESVPHLILNFASFISETISISMLNKIESGKC